MKKFIPYLKGLLLLCLVIFLYGFTSHRNNAKKISKIIDINFENGDNLFITYETVNKLLIQNYDGLKNQPKENIFLNRLEQVLLSNEMIEKAEVFMNVNGELGAVIIQKTPIARVNQGSTAYYIDRNGRKMPLSSSFSARVPIVEGIQKGIISDEVFKLVTVIYNDEFLKKQIVGVEQISTKEFVLKTRIGNQTVELGSLNELDQKIKKLKVFYQKAINGKILENYKTINLEYANQVVCSKK